MISVTKKLEMETFKKKFPELDKYKIAKEDSYSFTLTSEMEDNLILPNRMVQAETDELFLINSNGETSTYHKSESARENLQTVHANQCDGANDISKVNPKSLWVQMW